MLKKHAILLSALVLIFPVASDANTIGSIVVNGDSLSDNGNLFAATGRPGLPGVLTPLQYSQPHLSPYLGELFVVWGGPDGFLSPSPLDPTVPWQIARAVGDLVVDTLQTDGVTNVFVPGMPDLGLTPYRLDRRRQHTQPR